MAKSRLSRRLEKQSSRSFLYLLVGTVAIIILFIRFGLPFFANVSVMIAGLGRSQETTQKKATTYVQPPLFAPILSGTNSALLIVSGTATEGQTINIYLNDSLIDKTTVGKDNTFVFEDITLKPGENHIKAKAITKENDESDYSNDSVIVYKNSAPTLTIDSPKDGQTFSKDENTATISGITDPRAVVVINDLRAIVDDTTGSFSYTLPLKNGENKITVVATDEAGNKTQKELKITYNP